MTKLKIGIIGALTVAVFATPVVIEHQSIAKLRQDNQALRQQVEQLTPLQAETERLSNIVASSTPSPAQDSAVHELVRLRAEVGMLRDNVTLLRRQTNNLAKLRQENQQLHADLASFAAAKRTESPAPDPAATAQNACINNLRLIDAAKQQWALEQRKQTTDTPEWSDLQPYLGRGPNGELPICPSGGAYTIGTVKEKPLCNVAGHELP